MSKLLNKFPLKLSNLILVIISLVLISTPIFGSLSCSDGNYSGKAEPLSLAAVLQEGTIPFFVAESQGIFAKNGINFNLKYYDSGAQSNTAMLNGEVDLAYGVGDYVMATQAMSKQPIQVIGDLDQAELASFIARTDRGIKSASDLIGKRIGVVRGTASEFYVDRFFKLNGLDIKSVTLVNITANAQAAAAVINGNVDAAVTVPPFVDDARDKLGSNAVVWSAQSNQLNHLLVTARTQWIQDHTALITRLLKTLNEAEDFIFQHPQEAKAIAKNKLNISDEELAKIWDRNQFSLNLNESLIAAMQDESRWLIENELTQEKQIPDFTKYIYTNGLKAVKPEAVDIIH